MAPLVWLVTGCSSGFGRIFARQILSRGDFVIATARKVEALDDLSKAGASVMRLDVTDDQDTISDTIQKAMSIHGRIDVLVNNAAFVLGGAWEDLSQAGILCTRWGLPLTLELQRRTVPSGL